MLGHGPPHGCWAPLAGGAPGLYLRKVLLFCQQRPLELGNECAFAGLLGEGNKRLPAGIIGQFSNAEAGGFIER